jgi:hypothetical protein
MARPARRIKAASRDLWRAANAEAWLVWPDAVSCGIQPVLARSGGLVESGNRWPIGPYTREASPQRFCRANP